MKHDITILRTSKFGNTRSVPGLESATVANGGDVQIEFVAQVSRTEWTDMQRDPSIVAVAPDMPLLLIKPVNSMDGGRFRSEFEDVTWGVRAVGADTSPFDGAGITVAILDTGIDETHPAFSGVELVIRDFTKSGTIADRLGHGTHCAGTVFGRNLNGLRIGVAPGVKRALIGKVLDPSGGSSASLAQAMFWAAQNGSRVISLSLGIDFPGFVSRQVGSGMHVQAATSTALEAYRLTVSLFEKLVGFFNAQAAFGDSVLVVAATGNESLRPSYTINLSPPAAAPGIIGVAALRQDGLDFDIADFSNTGGLVAAPGVEITSAWPGGGLNTMSGTSMATPHAAGVSALWAQRLAKNGTVSPAVLQARLLASCTRQRIRRDVQAADVGEGLVQAPQW